MVEAEDTLPRMTLPQHLDELRARLVASALALVVAMVGAFLCYEPLWAFAVRPYVDTMKALGHADAALLATAPGEGFLQTLRLCFLVGLVAASPIVLWQMWGFISAGLYEKEKGAVRVFFPVSIVLFGMGVVAAYLLLIPFGLNFLVGFDQGLSVTTKYTVTNYLDICVKMVLAMGFLFELPLVMLFLQASDLVQRRTLLKGWRWAVVLAFVVGMLLTDPSPVTQIVMALPVIGLYFLGIWGGRFVGEHKERFTVLKAWPIVLGVALYAVLLVFRAEINAWSTSVFGGAGPATAPEAAPAGGAPPEAPR
jgi:sec-independent protein translocase protein TatC